MGIKAKESEYSTIKIKTEVAYRIAGLIGLMMKWQPSELWPDITDEEKKIIKRHISILSSVGPDMEF